MQKPKYKIASLTFTSKTQLTQVAKVLFGPWKNGREPFTGEAKEFFIDLLRHHHQWNEKTQGRSIDQIHLQPESMWSEYQRPTYGIRLYFGAEKFRGDDISWHQAIKDLKRNINNNTK